MRALRPLVVALALLGVAPGAAAAASVRGANGPLSVSMIVGTHQPKANAKWPIQVTATLSGRPARCGIGYAFLFGGQVVSSPLPRYPDGKPHTSFTGHFSDTLSFPARSEGYPLTLQVHVWSGSRAVNLDYVLQVVR